MTHAEIVSMRKNGTAQTGYQALFANPVIRMQRDIASIAKSLVGRTISGTSNCSGTAGDR